MTTYSNLVIKQDIVMQKLQLIIMLTAIDQKLK